MRFKFRDNTQAEAVLAKVDPQAVLADKGYNADGLPASRAVRQITLVIPPMANRRTKRDCDFALYWPRNPLERLFHFMKQSRGIAARYE